MIEHVELCDRCVDEFTGWMKSEKFRSWVKSEPK
jgi:hypothetical protein